MSKYGSKKYNFKNCRKMKKKLIGIIAVVVIIVVAGYNVYAIQNSHNNVQLSELILANIEGLAYAEGSGETGQYEYPDGYPYTSTCNVRISKWRKCKVELIICQGGGSGCNSKNCPVHKS